MAQIGNNAERDFVEALDALRAQERAMQEDQRRLNTAMDALQEVADQRSEDLHLTRMRLAQAVEEQRLALTLPVVIRVRSTDQWVRRQGVDRLAGCTLEHSHGHAEGLLPEEVQQWAVEKDREIQARLWWHYNSDGISHPLVHLYVSSTYTASALLARFEQLDSMFQ